MYIVFSPHKKDAALPFEKMSIIEGKLHIRFSVTKVT